MKKIIIILSLLISLSSCLKENDSVAILRVKANLPAEYSTLDLTKVVVKLQNKVDPFTHKINLNANGEAEFRVQPGKYDVLASAIFSEEKLSVGTSLPEFLLMEEGILDKNGSYLDASISLSLEAGTYSPIVIREIYYHGSKTLSGANYTKDRYIELYNNSDMDQFLDSLCIATANPANSNSGNSAWIGSDIVPIFQMLWMIPGRGNDFKLKPGTSAVVALNAVNHNGRATSALDLSKAHFGYYDQNLTGHEISPNVTSLTRIIAGQGTSYGFSVSSPAFYIFRPEMGIEKYLKDAKTWELFEPGKTSGSKFWHVDKSWILDGVECVISPSQSLKRLSTSVDVSYTYIQEGGNSGLAITRKVSETLPDGRIIYQDTNNSAEDFLTGVKPSPTLKK